MLLPAQPRSSSLWGLMPTVTDCAVILLAVLSLCGTQKMFSYFQKTGGA
jgi:hypothetical protein